MDEQDLALFAKLEDRLQGMEELLAHLFQGYVELASITESCIAQILKPLETKAAQEFTQEMAQHRQAWMSMAQGVADGMVQGRFDDADAMAPVVDDE